MRIYKKLTIFTIIIAVIALSIAILLHYLIPCVETEFWINVLVGIFGSAVLTTLTSIVSYHYERRKILEGFVYHTRQILSYLNKYQENMPLEQKLQFFLDYDDLDKSAWDMDFGDMDFFFEKVCGNRKYIYNCIYKPILDFNAAVANHIWHFRWHLDGCGKNERVMLSFLAELQDYLIGKTECDVPSEYDEDGNVSAFYHYSTVQPKLVLHIQEEINGRYYDIMYGKNIFKKKLTLQGDENNGQTQNADSE